MNTTQKAIQAAQFQAKLASLTGDELRKLFVIGNLMAAHVTLNEKSFSNSLNDLARAWHEEIVKISEAKITITPSPMSFFQPECK